MSFEPEAWHSAKSPQELERGRDLCTTGGTCATCHRSPQGNGDQVRASPKPRGPWEQLRQLRHRGWVRGCPARTTPQEQGRSCPRSHLLPPGAQPSIPQLSSGNRYGAGASHTRATGRGHLCPPQPPPPPLPRYVSRPAATWRSPSTSILLPENETLGSRGVTAWGLFTGEVTPLFLTSSGDGKGDGPPESNQIGGRAQGGASWVP